MGSLLHRGPKTTLSSRSAIGIILSSVRQSVCDAVHCDAPGRYRWLKVVPSCFIRRFCCGIGYIDYPQHTAKNRTAEISASEIAMAA